jgi:type I restriction-modification system DNA methylase subunit
MVDSRLVKIQESLNSLEKNRDLQSAKTVVRDVSALLVPDLSGDVDSIFRLFNDQEGKLKANASWFFSDTTITDKLATYTLDTPAESNLDIKVFGVKKAKKGTISWAVGLTPNFEDEPFNSRYNVGIDFIIPESLDRVIIALSKNYVIRTLELKGQLTATFQEILNSWIMITDLSRKVEFHELLWKSLDLSPINKKFYEGISQRFISLRQHIETSGVLDHEHAAQFANRLIGRVIFTWFLDKKSLIEPSIKYFESEAYQDDNDYYREQLESLFFEVLNTPLADRSAADKSTPYLNGGLFEPKPGDLYKDKTLTFPKNFFDDFLGFLRAYNFTTDESTTEFQQVAIDPEMLGRIFENLLAEVSDESGEQARKAKGAFYTPREIVDYMCKEALKSYIRTMIPNEESLDARLYQLIDASERQFQDQDHNWRRDFKQHKDRVINALDNLKVLDPACGSGAFPIGMMQLLVRVYERLEPRLDHHKVKLAIIQRNIYGTDIEPMAVEISRLRAWLALVVDQDSDSRAVKPLPNLDFKFVAANSLIPLDSLGQLSFFEDESLDSKLQEIRESYFNTESLKQKSKFKQKYQALVDSELTLFGDSKRTAQLKTFRPFEADTVSTFFDSVHMFGFDKFDIVIGNPPYVRQEKIGYKDKLKEYKVFSKTSDLYTYFFELASKLLVEGGVTSLIVSSKFGRALYGSKLREFLGLNSTIDYIVDHQGQEQFAAAVNTWILQTRNKRPTLEHTVKISFPQLDTFTLLPQISLGSSGWSFVEEGARDVFDRLANKYPPLGQSGILVKRGITTGCTEAFLIDESTKNHLLNQDSTLQKVIFKVLRGKDISRYKTRFANLWIIVTKNGLNVRASHPILGEYFESKNEILGGKLESRSDQGSHWMNLRDCSYYSLIESEKIIWSELAPEGRFARSKSDEYIVDTAYLLNTEHVEYLLAILNSKLVLSIMQHTASRLGENGLRWKRHVVDKIPIPPISSISAHEMVELKNKVRELESCDQALGNAIQVELDTLVYQIYELSDAEIEAISRS